MTQSNSLVDSNVYVFGHELTIFKVKALHDDLVNFLAPTENALAIDLSAVREIDAAGLQFLLAIDCQLRKAGGQLQIAQCSVEVQECFDLFNVDLANPLLQEKQS